MAKTVSQEKNQRNPYVGIAGAIGGTTIGMIALIMIFGDTYKWVAFPVTLCMAVFGIALGFFASRK